jgi:hypothetical protein
MTVIRTDGRTEPVIAPDLETQRANRIIADPKLRDIAEALSDDLTRQRLRVAFEKISKLVGKGDNALVKMGTPPRMRYKLAQV